jgi:hypothetical protein
MKKISFLKKKLFLHLMFLLLGRYVLASSDQFLPMPIVNRDSHFLKLNISDFKVDSTANLVKHEFLGSIFWERSSEKILLPFLKIRLKNAKPDHVNLHFRYKDVTYLPQVIGSDVAVDIDFSIFEPSKIEVFEDGKRVGEVGVHVLAAGKKIQFCLIILVVAIMYRFLDLRMSL